MYLSCDCLLLVTNRRFEINRESLWWSNSNPMPKVCALTLDLWRSPSQKFALFDLGMSGAILSAPVFALNADRAHSNCVLEAVAETGFYIVLMLAHSSSSVWIVPLKRLRCFLGPVQIDVRTCFSTHNSPSEKAIISHFRSNYQKFPKENQFNTVWWDEFNFSSAERINCYLIYAKVS